MMVHFCTVPRCSNRSDRETQLSFHRVPRNKKVLKQWVHNIGRAQLAINDSTRVCSEHFVDSRGRKLRPDEVPTLNLPLLTTNVSQPAPRRPLVRYLLPEKGGKAESEVVPITSMSTAVNTDLTGAYIESLEKELDLVKEELKQKKQNVHFRLQHISNDDAKVRFYTGFSTISALRACYDYLGPSVNHLKYWSSSLVTDESSMKSNTGRKRILPPMEEFFLVLVRLRLGLLEEDLAYRFGVSQSTVSRIIITWINFLYLQLKQIPLWSPKALVMSYMPKAFKEKYPSTRVVIDATEVFIEQPALPELQQLTYSNYKNHNTFKGLIGISPSGVVTFVSDLYPGSISDKELTRRSGLLELLQPGDSVMADRGFSIEEDLALVGARLNIPPFLRGKDQLSENELVEARRIASLRIHVERSMEQIKNFHIFDKLLPPSLIDTSNQIFFICAVLTNFNPPLCA